ncbi:hypothetical protein APHAL10511_005714 [Amanita phalloides]|nr:hypothetical protein APHAL10511_005714 [Amanita phalloides]
MSRSSSSDSVHDPISDFEERVVHKSWIQKFRMPLSRGSDAQQFIADNAGLLLVVLAEALLSAASVTVKRMNGLDPPMSTLQVVMVRMGMTYIFSLAYILWIKIDDPILGPKGVRLLLVFRGVSGFIALFGTYYPLQYLSLSDATVLTFLSPMCTAIAGALFLREKFRPSQALAGVVSLLGVVLIARPPSLFGTLTGTSDSIITDVITSESKVTPTRRMIAVGVALIGVLGLTGAYISISAIGKRAHALHTMAYFSIICFVMSTIGMIFMRIPVVIPSRLDWMALLLMFCIFGFVAQVFLTMGLQREAAGRASMGVYTKIVFATIFQRIFFHTTPPWLSIIGIYLILSSALYVAVTKQKKKQSTVGLNPDDFDHMEAALHATHASTSHADLSLLEQD